MTIGSNGIVACKNMPLRSPAELWRRARLEFTIEVPSHLQIWIFDDLGVRLDTGQAWILKALANRQAGLAFQSQDFGVLKWPAKADPQLIWHMQASGTVSKPLMYRQVVS